MNDIQLIRFLKAHLSALNEQAQETNTALIDIIGNKCRSCRKQQECWKIYHYTLLTEVSLDNNKSWECANYSPKNCASVMGRPFTIRIPR